MKELFDKLSFSPKISLGISIGSLAFVLLNNHIYLKSLQDREQKLSSEESKLDLREEGNAKKERTLKIWEMELMQREDEVKRILEIIKAKQKYPQDSRFDSSSP